jgi:hypothetical protein
MSEVVSARHGAVSLDSPAAAAAAYPPLRCITLETAVAGGRRRRRVLMRPQHPTRALLDYAASCFGVGIALDARACVDGEECAAAVRALGAGASVALAAVRSRACCVCVHVRACVAFACICVCACDAASCILCVSPWDTWLRAAAAARPLLHERRRDGCCCGIDARWCWRRHCDA